MDETDDINIETLENSTENHSEPLSNEPIKIEKPKYVRLPLAKIKSIMKMDPDCKLISQESILLVTKATELFLEQLSKETVKSTIGSKRKTVMKRDVDNAIDNVPQLCFLEGALE